MRLFNASEIIIMRACVSLLAAAVFLTVDVCSPSRRRARCKLIKRCVARNQQTVCVKKEKNFPVMQIFTHKHTHTPLPWDPSSGDPPLLIKTLDKPSVCPGRGRQDVDEMMNNEDELGFILLSPRWTCLSEQDPTLHVSFSQTVMSQNILTYIVS